MFVALAVLRTKETAMGILDKVVSAITPEASDEDKAKARVEARKIAGSVGWLNLILDHHEQIDAAFADVREAGSASAQRAAQKKLALLLTGHSIAEEAVIYPAMALGDQKAHSGEAYTEQSAAKVQTTALDDLEPLSQDYMDKLEHLRAAVSHHVYEEESDWFPTLRQSSDATLQNRLTVRYKAEFDRYMGADS